MVEVLPRIVAAAVCATLFCLSTTKLLGAMQQSGYKNGVFCRWTAKKDNQLYTRLIVFAVCLAISTGLTGLAFSFLGITVARVIAALPFFVLCMAFIYADGKYALKVGLKKTGRVKRLFATYWLLTACVSYLVIALLAFFAAWNGSKLYNLIAFAPYCLLPVALPCLLCLANVINGIFENARNKKFVQRAGQVLDETQIIRVGVVGSYGKTSVKNILATLLSEKYTVVATPQSYNTPVGVAKTVFSDAFAGKQVFIAEMGARKKGDIAELCRLVKPDYALFTGVCEQHVETFGSLENILAEKSEILRYTSKKTVCADSLRSMLGADVTYATAAENVVLSATQTKCTLTIGGEQVEVETSLLGGAAVENIALAATLAYEMGLTAQEIARGIQKLQPVEHRLQLIEQNGVYVLDDGYNANLRGAQRAIEALCRFDGKKYLVTPGIVECGVLEKQINGKLGEMIAQSGVDKTVLVGQTLVTAVKKGYLDAGGDEQKLTSVLTLDKAIEKFGVLEKGDCILFLNDLPDVY